eukprot:scaffold22880_cov35-Prasinocladus_malaysianus.AAC.1
MDVSGVADGKDVTVYFNPFSGLRHPVNVVIVWGPRDQRATHTKPLKSDSFLPVLGLIDEELCLGQCMNFISGRREIGMSGPEEGKSELQRFARRPGRQSVWILDAGLLLYVWLSCHCLPFCWRPPCNGTTSAFMLRPKEKAMRWQR